MVGFSRCARRGLLLEGLVVGGDPVLHNLTGFLGGSLVDHQILRGGLEQGRSGGLLITEADQEDVGG